MAEIKFMFNGSQIIIQCSKEEKMKDLFKRFANKSNTDINSIIFLYDGNKINEDLKLNELINSIDKQSNKMSILVYNKNTIKENEGVIKSKEIICPKCKENCLIKIKDYKIILYGCKNQHINNNILLNEFENTQNINELNIKCNNCNNNKYNSYNKQFYKCLTCKYNLCPLCNSKHNKLHEIIDYNKKNYICNIHNDLYISYCNECKINLCMLCEKEHNNKHNIINYKNIIENKNKLKEEMNEFKKKIDNFNNKIREIIKELNNIIENINILYEINNNIINNY